MRQTVSALLCILAIITGTNALGPQLSPSFSFQGTAVSTITTGTTTYTRYDLAIDIPRGLVYFKLDGISGGVARSLYELASANDNSGYGVLNGVCNGSAYTGNPSDPMGIQVYFWSAFDNVAANPPGTYVVTVSQVVLTLVTVNGLPVTFTSIATGTSTSSFALTITNYINTTPPFSTFTLPAACSQFNCTACYDPAATTTATPTTPSLGSNLGSSFILMLLALVALAIIYSRY